MMRWKAAALSVLALVALASPAPALQRVANGTQLASQPSVASTTGTPGYFGKTSDGAPAPTVVDRDWFNEVQETLINPLTAAGLTLSTTDNTQLTQAINYLSTHYTATAGTARDQVYQTAGVNRWRLEVDGAAESGSNVGSDFNLGRYTDAGSLIDNPFKCVRSTGICAFSQTPTNPTPSPGDNSTKSATTAFVAASFAPLASPALTGSPTTPTQTLGDNTTKIASDAFVQAAIAANPSAFTTKFTSSGQTISCCVVFANHGLGAQPFGFTAVLHCVTSDSTAGYVAGQEVALPATTNNGTSGGSSPFGTIAVYADSTAVYVAFDTASIWVANGTTGARAQITPAKWTIILRAWL